MVRSHWFRISNFPIFQISKPPTSKLLRSMNKLYLYISVQNWRFLDSKSNFCVLQLRCVYSSTHSCKNSKNPKNSLENVTFEELQISVDIPVGDISVQQLISAGGQIFNSNLTARHRIFPDADQCKRWGGAAPGSHRVLGAAVFSNKSCTRYFLKLPWQFAFCIHTYTQDFPVKTHRYAREPAGVSGKVS